MKEELGIGFVGAGGNTRMRHLPGFAAIEGVRLVTVANRSEESSKAVAKEFEIERISPDWKAVVADPEVDAICIGTWPYLHADITTAALEAGKHVLTEARMSSDLSGAMEMLAASERHPELVAQIVPSPFTLNQDSTVKRMLANGDLGEIREVFIEHAMGALLDPEAPLTWRQDPTYSGINMLTSGIYHEVIQRWIAEPMEVTAASGSVFTKERAHWETGKLTPVTLPDTLHILGRMQCGAILNYHFSGIEKGPARNEIRVVGSKSALRLDVGAGELYRSSGDGQEERIEIPESEKRDWQVEADFVASIRDGRPVELTSFQEGVRYMAFTDAVYARIRGR